MKSSADHMKEAMVKKGVERVKTMFAKKHEKKDLKKAYKHMKKHGG